MLFGRTQVFPILLLPLLLPLLVACSSGGDDKKEEQPNEAEQSAATDETPPERVADNDQSDVASVRDRATELAVVEQPNNSLESLTNTHSDEGHAETEPTEDSTERPTNTETPRPETPLSPDEMIRRMDELIARTDAVIRRSLSTTQPQMQGVMTAPELRKEYAVEQQRFEESYGQFLEAVNKLLVDDDTP